LEAHVGRNRFGNLLRVKLTLGVTGSETCYESDDLNVGADSIVGAGINSSPYKLQLLLKVQGLKILSLFAAS